MNGIGLKIEASDLLKYVLTIAGNLAENNLKKLINPDYYMAALLKVIHDIDKGSLPKELDNISTKKEVYRTVKILHDYRIDFEGTSYKILNDVRKETYDSEKSELILVTVVLVLNLYSVAKDLKNVPTDLFTKHILKDPTKTIEEHIISHKTDRDDSESEEENDDIWDDKVIDNFIGFEKEGVREANGKKFTKDTVSDTMNLQRILQKKIFGQEHAINTFVSGYFQAQISSRIGNTRNKPKATFLFAGPPGVGKTYLAETAAGELRLPFCRFDMSEYSDKESAIEFSGVDPSYKSAKEGNVTGFVNRHPHCVLLFDEIEKAHMNVIHLFLQILDAGRIRDNFTDKEVSFEEAIIIFTTNAGKLIYEDSQVENLSMLPKNKIIKALSSEINPVTNLPMFPPAICSRFAFGNVIMFNHLKAHNLLKIASEVIDLHADNFVTATGIEMFINKQIPAAIVFSEGGKADARTVTGGANSFFFTELYELFRLMTSFKESSYTEKLESLTINISFDDSDEQVINMFKPSKKLNILVFGSGELAEKCRVAESFADIYFASDTEEAKNILLSHEITMIIVDIRHKIKADSPKVLSAEDIRSEGMDFLYEALNRYSVPVYILRKNEKDMQIEQESFFKMGVNGFLTASSKSALEQQIFEKRREAFLESNMLSLAKANKVVTYKTSQSISKNGKKATITLSDFKLVLSEDAEDSSNILNSSSKPETRFTDVIGAEDAKTELNFFVKFLKNPKLFATKGLKAPRGVLLYGPPGTGKTLLAKAVAGESDATFFAAEGNQFLKKYTGEGPDAVHSLFAAARKYAPAIIFVDEIDALAKTRFSSANEHTSDILTAFLTEMDGFKADASKPVFVLAATNLDLDSLDPALIRRFDRKILVDLPDKEERTKFIKTRAEKTPMLALSDEQIENIAVRSTGMSLADLDSVVELAMRISVRMDSLSVDDVAFEEAFETFNNGTSKTSEEMQLIRTARHEAGHALLCWYHGEKPSYLTIVSRGDHSGYMQHENSESKGVYTKTELLNRICVALGGRAAEIVCYGNTDGISTGPSSDIRIATEIARNMICSYGMDDEIGLAYINHEDKEAAGEIRQRIDSILKEELDTAIKVIEENRGFLDSLVEKLLSLNHLKEKEIENILLDMPVKKNHD